MLIILRTVVMGVWLFSLLEIRIPDYDPQGCVYLLMFNINVHKCHGKMYFRRFFGCGPAAAEVSFSTAVLFESQI